MRGLREVGVKAIPREPGCGFARNPAYEMRVA